jgi:hypothetical protein
MVSLLAMEHPLMTPRCHDGAPSEDIYGARSFADSPTVECLPNGRDELHQQKRFYVTGFEFWPRI